MEGFVYLAERDGRVMRVFQSEQGVKNYVRTIVTAEASLTGNQTIAEGWINGGKIWIEGDRGSTVTWNRRSVYE